MTHRDQDELTKLFKRVARKALIVWETDTTDDELVSELWIWYLESPHVQGTLASLEAGQQLKYVRRQVFNILTKEVKDRDLFEDRVLYSSDSVRQALSGNSSNKYLELILPAALEALALKNAGQYEAVCSRYFNNVVPSANSAEAAKLKRAVKSLTERVNILTITAKSQLDGDGNLVVKDGPGSKTEFLKKRPVDNNAESPDLIKVKGEHGDPTANIAIMLMGHPELRDEYLYETPIREFLKGKGGA